MNLYLFRHGIAEERGQKADFDRRLTQEGRARTRKVAMGMKRLQLAFDVILSSPLLRAWETAEIAAEVLEHPDPIVRCDELACGVDVAKLFKVLEKYRAAQHILLVGHEPDMSEMLSYFISGDTDAAINFKKAGLACVFLNELAPERGGELQWLLTPGQLALLGEAKAKG